MLGLLPSIKHYRDICNYLYFRIDPVGAANLLVSSSQDAADLATWRPFSDPHSAASAILASIAAP